MAPTTIFFNGRLISAPGSYTEVDTAGLEQVGLSANGIVAVLGTAEGGIPVKSITSLDDVIRITKHDQALRTFRSGQLREVAGMLFNPGNDPAILGGALQIIMLKVNPATQSTGTLANTYGNSMDMTSEDYGAFTSQVNIQIASGTSQGKLVTITFEDTVETADDLGGDNTFTITYTKPTGGWDTMTCNVESGGAVVADATRDQAGLDSEVTAQPTAASLLTVVSANAADTTQQIILYGLDGTGAAVSETLNLNGTTSLTGTQSFATYMGCRIVGTTAGTVTVTDDDPATIDTITAGANPTSGLATCSAVYVAGALSVAADGATTKNMMLIGANAIGATQLEKLTLNGTATVAGTATWSEVTFLAMGEVEAARTVTLTGEAGRTAPGTQNTITKVADYYNARGYGTSPKYGFTFTTVTTLTSFDPANLDVTDGAGGAVNCLNPAAPGFKSDLWAILNWINTSSQYMTATAATGAKGGAPSNTTSPVFLAGGQENMAAPDADPLAFQDWQDALNLAKRLDVNTIVPLTHDAAVHAALKSHCEYMAGVGRNERDGVVGALNAGGTAVATKSELKTQASDLNTRHIRLCPQTISRYNTSGELEEFAPYYQAALIAGMQAGSPVGTSLTFKYANTLSLTQDSSWNPLDDVEEMITAGICFMEEVEGVGRRVVRNITTHLSSSNIAYTEASVNEATNYAVKTFRREMETVVGQPGFAGTVNAAKGTAEGILSLLVDAGVLTAHRSLAVELIVDVLEVEVEIAPVIPVNFVKSTIHLFTTPISAS